jgi:hypothetical protein
MPLVRRPFVLLMSIAQGVFWHTYQMYRTLLLSLLPTSTTACCSE